MNSIFITTKKGLFLFLGVWSFVFVFVFGFGLLSLLSLSSLFVCVPCWKEEEEGGDNNIEDL